jgi:hypothetical protein
MSMGYVAAVGGGMMLANAMGGDSGQQYLNDPLAGQAALKNAEIAQEQWQWYKDRATEMKPHADEAVQLSLDMARSQASLAERQVERGDEAYDNYMNKFRPIEDRIASEAMNYDTAERRSEAAGAAMADVAQNLEAQRSAQTRSQQRMGVNPNSGKALALGDTMSLGTAVAKVNAANQGRKQVETMGAAKMADAANLGRGIATNNATQTQLGLTAGNSAVNNSQVPINLNTIEGNQAAQAAQTAISGNTAAGNLSLGQYRAADNSSDAMYGALGQIGGAYISRYSDKNMKTGRKKVSGKAALDQVKELPATEKWRYRDDSPAADGGQEHVGHMAQDVNASMGEDVAPGGRIVRLDKMAGVGLAAIKEVAKKQEKMEKRVIRLELATQRA